MRKAVQYVGLLISVMAVVWFSIELADNLEIFRVLSTRQVPALVMAVVVYSATPLISNLAWHKLLLSVGATSTNLPQTVAIGFVSQFAKYLPGNIVHHLSRVVLAKSCGHTITNLLTTVFFETLWVMSVAAVIAAFAIIVMEGDFIATLRQQHHWSLLLIVLFTAAIVPYIAQSGIRGLVNWWAKRNDIEARSVTVPSLSTFSLVCGLYVLNFILLGVVMFIIVGLFSDLRPLGIFTLTGIFAVAWIVGFVTPGAPAGIGIRELILVAALSPAFGGELAVGIAATLRAITVVGDGLVFVEGGILYRLTIGTRKIVN